MTDLHVLTVTYGPQSAGDSYFFKSEESAAEALDLLAAGNLRISDDFGSTALICEGYHSVRVSSVPQMMEAQIENQLCQARAQAKAQQRANSDPLLKLVGAPRGPLQGMV